MTYRGMKTHAVYRKAIDIYAAVPACGPKGHLVHKLCYVPAMYVCCWMCVSRQHYPGMVCPGSEAFLPSSGTVSTALNYRCGR